MHYAFPAELVVVPLETAVASLITVRAEAASRLGLAKQIANAVRRAEAGLERGDRGGSAGAHGERCFLARALRAAG